MGGVPISVALAAGALAVVNPCAFPLLPAFLSFYLGVEEDRLPPAATRVAQGLAVGGLVTVGFVGLFALAGLPIAFGVGVVAQAIPWVGIGTGALLAVVGLAALAGVHVAVPVRLGIRPRRVRRSRAIVLFGVGYGAASLGCTLPIFLAMLGASLGGDRVAVFTAYGVGMAVVMMTLAVAVALLREGLTRWIRPFLRYAERVAGGLLVVSGGYLTYYWSRVHFGNVATISADPVVGFVTSYAARVQNAATGHAWLLLAVMSALLAAAVCVSLWQRRRRGPLPRQAGARSLRRRLAFAGAAAALAAAVVLAVLAVPRPGGGKSATGRGTTALTNVHTAAQFVSLFNAASGEPRLVVLVSPT